MTRTIRDLQTWTFFGDYPKTQEILRNMVEGGSPTVDSATFSAGFTKAQGQFDKEYSTTRVRMERLDQIKTLLSRAVATDKKKFGRAFGKMNAQELLFESPFPTIERLQRQEDSVEDYFLCNTSDYDGNIIPVLRIAVPEIRYLRRCLGYLLMCEGWFEEAAKFFYRLSGVINPSQAKASETEDYVARVRDAKCPRLVEGYNSTIRNAVAHAHVRLDRKHFTFTNPRNKGNKAILTIS